MFRLLILLSVSLVGCVKPWTELKTSAGIRCADMPIYPADKMVDRPHLRIKPVRSRAYNVINGGKECTTEAERLESLREAACRESADAVIEAVNEEVSIGTRYCPLASGTAVRWETR